MKHGINTVFGVQTQKVTIDRYLGPGLFEPFADERFVEPRAIW